MFSQKKLCLCCYDEETKEAIQEKGGKRKGKKKNITKDIKEEDS